MAIARANECAITLRIAYVSFRPCTDLDTYTEIGKKKKENSACS
jgi:hypothetical protein